MKNGRVLYSSDVLHKTIKSILASPDPSDRRVVLVAYLGSEASSFLPSPQRMRVICSPTPGSTDPSAIRQLIKRKANVEFSNRLHMKVYWSHLRGCVICSANASSGALGRGGLREAGVFLPPRAVDIDRLIRYAEPKPVTARFMDRLDRGWRRKRRTRPGRSRRGPFRRRGVHADYLKWYESPYRLEWKLALFSEGDTPPARAAKERCYREYGIREPSAGMAARPKDYKEADWVLRFRVTARGVRGTEWMYTDFVVRVHPSEKGVYRKDYPFQAIQVNPPTHYPLPPFPLTADFRRALNLAVRAYGEEPLAEVPRPPKRFLDRIATSLRKK